MNSFSGRGHYTQENRLKKSKKSLSALDSTDRLISFIHTSCIKQPEKLGYHLLIVALKTFVLLGLTFNPDVSLFLQLFEFSLEPCTEILTLLEPRKRSLGTRQCTR
jgi:hypothetical protein